MPSYLLHIIIEVIEAKGGMKQVKERLHVPAEIRLGKSVRNQKET